MISEDGTTAMVDELLSLSTGDQDDKLISTIAEATLKMRGDSMTRTYLSLYKLMRSGEMSRDVMFDTFHCYSAMIDGYDLLYERVSHTTTPTTRYLLNFIGGIQFRNVVSGYKQILSVMHRPDREIVTTHSSVEEILDRLTQIATGSTSSGVLRRAIDEAIYHLPRCSGLVSRIDCFKFLQAEIPKVKDVPEGVISHLLDKITWVIIEEGERGQITERPFIHHIPTNFTERRASIQ